MSNYFVLQLKRMRSSWLRPVLVCRCIAQQPGAEYGATNTVQPAGKCRQRAACAMRSAGCGWTTYLPGTAWYRLPLKRRQNCLKTQYCLRNISEMFQWQPLSLWTRNYACCWLAGCLGFALNFTFSAKALWIHARSGPSNQWFWVIEKRIIPWRRNYISV